MKFRRVLTGVLCALGLWAITGTAAGNAPGAPENLKINLLEKPYGVPKEDLRFSWSFTDRDQNEKQTAYRIVIGETASDMQAGNYLIDTGWVESSGSTGVRIASEQLRDNELYYWSVQTKDSEGLAGGLSSPQAFSTAVSGEWASTEGIWGSDDEAFVFLRHTFETSGKQVEKAVASVTALSPEKARQFVFDFYINGSLVGMGPSRINNGELYYNSFDITEYILNGKNTAGAICYSEEQQAFLCQITMFYADGTSEVIVNSGRDAGKWRVLDADGIFGRDGQNLGVGAYYFANRQNMNGSSYPYGWSDASYSDAGWKNVSAAGQISQIGTLTPYPADNMTRYEQAAASVKKLDSDSYVIDLGKEIVGSLRLNINAPKETQITVSYGEELNGDGSVRYKMGTGNHYQEIWTLKQGNQALQDISMKTYRYVQIDGCSFNVTTHMVSGMAIRQEFSEDESAFSSSNGILNDIYGLTKYTIKATNQDLYVDSQGRERAPYEGDGLINALSSYVFEDDYSLSRFSLEYLGNYPEWPAEYQLLCISWAWQDYLYTGDASYLAEKYDQLKGKLYEGYFDGGVGLVKKPDKTLLIDWPATERDGYDSGVLYNTILNAVSVGAYEDMASIAEVLGKSADAEGFRGRAETIRNSMISRLYNKDTGRFCDGLNSSGSASGHFSQHATAYALSYGIYDSQDMADRMAAAISSDGALKMSVYGAFFMVQGLYESNQGLLARQMLSNPDTNAGVRSWAYMMYKLGATITTEAWNPESKGNMTYSHPWGASPASQIVRGMFGIQPLTGGFETFQVKLQPGGGASASVSTPTVKGSIKASYEMLGDGRLKTSLQIPGNTEAVVYLPAGTEQDAEILVNSQPVNAVYENGYWRLKLGSGSYELISESKLYEDTSELGSGASVSYRAYVAGSGWQEWKKNGDTAGTEGQKKGLEGLQFTVDNTGVSGGLQIEVHVASYGWLGYQDASQQSGRPGQGKSIQAVRLSLTGALAEKYDIYYRVHSQSYGWLGWTKNGEAAGTVGLGKQAEAIQVQLVAKGFVLDGSGQQACVYKDGMIMYQTHVQTYGWQGWKQDGGTSGTSGEAKRLEAVQIKLGASAPCAGGVEYRSYVQTYGWLDWVKNGETAGTEGQAKRMEAVQICLTGEMAERYDIYYRVHCQTFGWLDWAKNGESAGSADYAKRMEAIEIRLVPKGGAAPGSTAVPFRCPSGVFYKTHVQTYGWQGEVSNGAQSGTSGQAKRLEAIQIRLMNMDCSGDIEYRTHVQTYGWQGWVKNGAQSGTSGQAKRLEAIEIRLTGEMAERYDIYYRVHCQTYGWMDWVKNGEMAGTEGQAKRLEAIEIRIEPKAAAQLLTDEAQETAALEEFTEDTAAASEEVKEQPSEAIDSEESGEVTETSESESLEGSGTSGPSEGSDSAEETGAEEIPEQEDTSGENAAEEESGAEDSLEETESPAESSNETLLGGLAG